MKLNQKIWLIFIFLMFAGCANPTRDNPLDPKSENYTGTVALSGTVWTFYQPYSPVAGAVVTVSPGEFSTTTDASGNFLFNQLPEGNYWIKSTKGGFSADSLQLKLTAWETATADFHLDALPQFIEMKITSKHISRWWPVDDLYFLEIKSQVQDGDGLNDLQSVLLSIPQIAFSDTMQQDSPGRYSILLEKKIMPVSSLQNLIGSPVHLIAQDKAGYRSASHSIYLARVVEKLAVAESPRGLETTGSQPVLKWRSNSPPYDFTYKIDVNRDDAGIISNVWSKDLIPATTDSLQVGQSLPAGTYFWTISIVDSHGNSSRSKEAAFRIL